MVLNATFNNISVISGRSVLLVEETGVSGENHQQVTTQRHKQDSNSQLQFSYAVVNRTTMRPRRPLPKVLNNHDEIIC